MAKKIQAYQIEAHMDTEGAGELLLTIAELLSEQAQLLRYGDVTSDQLTRARAINAMAQRVEDLARDAERSNI